MMDERASLKGLSDPDVEIFDGAPPSSGFEGQTPRCRRITMGSIFLLGAVTMAGAFTFLRPGGKNTAYAGIEWAINLDSKGLVFTDRIMVSQAGSPEVNGIYVRVSPVYKLSDGSYEVYDQEGRTPEEKFSIMYYPKDAIDDYGPAWYIQKGQSANSAYVCALKADPRLDKPLGVPRSGWALYTGKLYQYDAKLPVPVIQGSGDVTVYGEWVPDRALIGKTTIKIEQGTTSGLSKDDSSDWSAKVTASVSSGFKVFGQGVEAEVGGEVAKSMAHSWGSTFQSSTVTTTEEEVTPKDGQMYLWKWVVTINDSVKDDPVYSFFGERALTANRGQPPKCLPGFSTDLPMYQKCTDNAHTISEIEHLNAQAK